MKTNTIQKNILRSTAFSALFVSLGMLSITAPAQAMDYAEWKDREDRHAQNMRHERDRLEMRKDVARDRPPVYYTDTLLRRGERFEPIQLPPQRVHIIPGFN